MAGPFHNFLKKKKKPKDTRRPVDDSAQRSSEPNREAPAAQTNPSQNTQPQQRTPALPIIRTLTSYANSSQNLTGPPAPTVLVNIYRSIAQTGNCRLTCSCQPRLADPKIDIDTSIRYQVNLHNWRMQNMQIMRPPPLGQVQLPSRQPTERPVAIIEPQKKIIINVVVVTRGCILRDRKPDFKPLPPVNPALRATVDKIERSQANFMQLFSRLSSMLETLNRRYSGNEEEPEPGSESESESESETDSDDAPGSSKRARHMSSSSSESHFDVEHAKSLAHYPQRVQLADGSSEYVLGPNGTRISSKQYSQIDWTSAPVATRCLLVTIFSNDELSTHTLTGKPSPAFYGRERPAKKMLDHRRVDDIVVSVRNRSGGKERHIRATITTKCADTAKKYRRRAKKALKDNVPPKKTTEE